MDDLISRKAAIDELVRWGKIPDYSDKEKILIGAVIGMLSSLPSAQPQRWIPCSETVDIPEYSVLACDKYGEYIIGFLCYEDDQWLCESEHEYMYDAVAWMPLPPSYKGGQE